MTQTQTQTTLGLFGQRMDFFRTASLVRSKPRETFRRKVAQRLPHEVMPAHQTACRRPHPTAAAAAMWASRHADTQTRRTHTTHLPGIGNGGLCRRGRRLRRLVRALQVGAQAGHLLLLLRDLLLEGRHGRRHPVLLGDGRRELGVDSLRRAEGRGGGGMMDTVSTHMKGQTEYVVQRALERLERDSATTKKDRRHVVLRGRRR